MFTEIVNKENLHPNYIQMEKDPCKVSILEKWADEKLVTRDGNNKFIKEFQTTFNSSLWELYCYQVLLKLGCHLDLKYDFPDFVFSFLNKELLIECTISNNSQQMPHEYDFKYRILQHDLEDIVYEQTLRLSNSFKSKYVNKYQKQSWVKSKPYIIALAPYEQPNFI